MALTPADVHNIAFSRPRIGKRGYDEQEVELLIDLVEQEQIRRLEEGELRSRNAELRSRDGGLQQRDAELFRREAALQQHEREAHQRGEHLRRQEAKLDQREAELREQQADLRRRLEQQQAVTPCVGAEAVPGQASRQAHAQQCREVPRTAAVNGGSRLQEARTVAPVRGRHDMERMAIRAVTDTHGNTVTETVHERTRAGAIDNGGPTAAYDRSELELLKEENADLKRSLGLLKSAAALLAAALEQA